jgi:hypothetical protein
MATTVHHNPATTRKLSKLRRIPSLLLARNDLGRAYNAAKVNDDHYQAPKIMPRDLAMPLHKEHNPSIPAKPKILLVEVAIAVEDALPNHCLHC